MKSFAVAVLSIAVLAGITSVGYGGQAPSDSGVVIPQQQLVPPPVSHSPSNQVDDGNRVEMELLRQQNTLLRGFQSDLLATVHWALGVAVGLAVALLGFGSYVSFRLYERDQRALLQRARAELASEVALLRAEQRSALLEEELRTNSALQEAETRSRNHIDAALSTEHESSSSGIKAERKFTQSVFELLRLELAQIRTAQDLDMKRPSSAVTRAVYELELAVKSGNDFPISVALESLLAAIDDGGGFYQKEVEKVNASLSHLPGSLKNFGESVRQKLSTVRIMTPEPPESGSTAL